MPSTSEHPDLTNRTDLTGALMDPDDFLPDDDSDLPRELTAAERLRWRRKDAFIPDDEATPDEYPTLRNMSAAFMFSGVVRPLEPTQPEP